MWKQQQILRETSYLWFDNAEFPVLDPPQNVLSLVAPDPEVETMERDEPLLPYLWLFELRNDRVTDEHHFRLGRLRFRHKPLVLRGETFHV